MQSQRLLYSESKRARAGSINKENSIKLFNDSFGIDCLGDNKKTSNQLRFDYENNTRIGGRSLKTVSEELTFSKPLERSPLAKNIDYNEAPRVPQIFSCHSLNQYESARKNSLITSQQQIESYTNKLLQNNQSYQQQIFQLKQQTAKTRSELQKSIAQNIKFRMAVQKKEQETKQQFCIQISQLVKELKQILQAKQQMEAEYNKYIQELMEEHSKQMEGREDSFSKTQQFFKEKLSNLKTHLSLNKEQKEKQYFQASECKLRLMKEIDQLNYSIQKEKNQKRELHKSNQEIIKIIKNLQKELKQTKENLEMAQLEVFKTEKDKNEIIIQLKNHNKSLCEGVKELQTKIEHLDKSLTKKQNDFAKLQDQLHSMKKELDSKAKAFVEKNLELQQTKAQRKQFQEQNIKLSQTLTHQKANFQKLIQELETSIRSLSSELSQTQSYLKSSQKQSSTLSSQVESLQKENAKLIEEINKFQQLNKKYKKDNIEFLQELEFLSLQNKAIKEEKVLKDNHLRTLEQMCEQLQKNRGKNKQFQLQKLRFFEQNQRIQADKTKEKNQQIIQIERLLRKKYESEIQALENQNLSLKAEMSQIVRQYEQKLSEKQSKWQLRVENIEKDLQNFINRGEPSQRLIERGLQSATHQRYVSARKQGRSPYILKNADQHQSKQEPEPRQDILSSLTRRDAIRNKYAQVNSPKQRDYGDYQRRVNPYEEENSFRKRDNKYFEDIEKRLSEFGNSRKISY